MLAHTLFFDPREVSRVHHALHGAPPTVDFAEEMLHTLAEERVIVKPTENA